MALTESYYFDILLKKDVDLIKQLSFQQKQYHRQKQNLATQTHKIKTLKTSLIKKKKSLHSQKNQYSRSLSSLQKEIVAFEKKQKQLQKNSLEIQRLIQQKSGKKKVYHAVGEFIKPAKGWISSRFGKRFHPIFKRYILHRGIDVAAPRGYKIKASNNGYILFAGWQKGYGNVTIINHGWKNGKKYSSSCYR